MSEEKKLLIEIRDRLAALESFYRKGRAPAVSSDTMSVSEFANAIGRGPLYVYRRIGSRQIAVRAGGKPYQIPADQVAKFQKVRATV